MHILAYYICRLMFSTMRIRRRELELAFLNQLAMIDNWAKWNTFPMCGNNLLMDIFMSL